MQKKYIYNLINDFINDDAGQGMVEYGLILGLVALICIVSITSIGNVVYDFFFGKLPSVLNTNTNVSPN